MSRLIRSLATRPVHRCACQRHDTWVRRRPQFTETRARREFQKAENCFFSRVSFRSDIRARGRQDGVARGSRSKLTLFYRAEFSIQSNVSSLCNAYAIPRLKRRSRRSILMATASSLLSLTSGYQSNQLLLDCRADSPSGN